MRRALARKVTGGGSNFSGFRHKSEPPYGSYSENGLLSPALSSRRGEGKFPSANVTGERQFMRTDVGCDNFEIDS